MSLFGEKKEISSSGFQDIRINIWGEKYGPRAKPVGLILLVIIAIIALGGLYPIYQMEEDTKDDVAFLEKELETITNRINQLRLPAAEEKQLQEIEKETEDVKGAIETIAQERGRNIPLIEKVMNIMPGQKWLASIALSENQVGLAGDTETVDNVFSLVRTLSQQEGFADATLSSMGDTAQKARLVSISEFSNSAIDITKTVEPEETELPTEAGTITINPGVIIAEGQSEGGEMEEEASGTQKVTIGSEPQILSFVSTVVSGSDMSKPPVTVKYEAEAKSVDPIQYYKWDFGDGTTKEVDLGENGPTHMILSRLHQYTELGDFTTSLTIRDIFGAEVTTGMFAKPNADFTAEMVTCENPLVIHFSNTSTAGTGGQVKGLEWDFDTGDEESADPKFPDVDSTDRNPTYYYEEPGEYVVKLTIETMQGDQASIEKKIMAGVPPTADFNPIPLEGDTPLVINFVDASVPGGWDAELVEWLWNFGDGQKSIERNPTHEYSTEGPYEVTLKVTESDGNCNTVSKTVQAAGPAGSHFFTAESTSESLIVKFAAIDEPVENAVYQWEFGDGNIATGRNATHIYGSVGTYTVSLAIIHMGDAGEGASEVTGASISAVADIEIAHSSSTPFSITVERSE